jgi:exonuclease SbcD
MNFLIVGDLHLGKGVSIGKPASPGKLNSRIQDQFNLLQWVIKTCQDNGVTNLILTGDVYQEPRPHPTTISMFMRWLKQCENNGIIVHIVAGNHDILRSGGYIASALDLVDAVEMKANVFSRISHTNFPNLSVVFIPYVDKRMYEAKDTDEALKKLETDIRGAYSKLDQGNMKIAIGHMALEGALAVGDEISDTMNEIHVPFEFFDGFDYVWMGHIHHQHVLCDRPHIAHIGSLDRSDFSRTETEHDKIAVLIKPEEKRYYGITIPTRTLAHIRIEVPVGKDSTEFVNNFICLYNKKNPLKEAIVRLEITLAGPEVENVNREKVEAYLYNNLDIHYVCNISESRAISPIQISADDSFDNTMEVSFAINKWAETRSEIFESDEERELFKALAHECRMEYEQKYLQKDNHEAS